MTICYLIQKKIPSKNSRPKLKGKLVIIRLTRPTGCPQKNALLSLKAYNSGLEAAIGASRDSFGIQWLWAFIWDQQVQDYVIVSLRKTRLKLATLSQNLTNCTTANKECPAVFVSSSSPKDLSSTWLVLVDTIISLATSHSQALTIFI